MKIGVPAETAAGEKRVATVPEVVEKLVKLGFSVAVQSGAGDPHPFHCTRVPSAYSAHRGLRLECVQNPLWA